MLSLMPLLMFFLCAGYAATVLRMVVAALDAPVGYEASDGFHYGLEPVRVRR